MLRNSLVAQRHHGIDLDCTARRDIRSQSGYAYQNKRHDGEGWRVAQSNPIEQVRQAGEHSRKYQCANCTERDAGKNQSHLQADEQSKNVSSIGAERHADADFLHPLRNRIGNSA